MKSTASLDGELVKGAIGMKQHLCVAINSLVELVVSIDSFVDVDFMRNDERRLGAARDDEVAQLTVVGLDVTLASAEEQTFLE